MATQRTRSSSPVRRNRETTGWAIRQLQVGPRAVEYQVVVRVTLKVLTFLPLLFVSPGILTGSGSDLSAGEADTLGTGAEILLILTLLVTPAITLTGWRWLAPMRRWYGVMFAVTAITDATLAAVTTTDFSGGIVGRLTGHVFLLAGLLMVCLALPLVATASNRAQKALGKYWKYLQRLTYAVWVLLWVHLALLEGLGFQSGINGSGAGPDGLAPFHQRLYQFTEVSLFLLVLRIPPVRKWCIQQRAEGRERRMWLVLAPLAVVFLVGFAFIVHEFFFKGIDMFRLRPSDE